MKAFKICYVVLGQSRAFEPSKIHSAADVDEALAYLARQHEGKMPFEVTATANELTLRKDGQAFAILVLAEAEFTPVAEADWEFFGSWGGRKFVLHKADSDDDCVRYSVEDEYGIPYSIGELSGDKAKRAALSRLLTAGLAPQPKAIR